LVRSEAAMPNLVRSVLWNIWGLRTAKYRRVEYNLAASAFFSVEMADSKFWKLRGWKYFNKCLMAVDSIKYYSYSYLFFQHVKHQHYVSTNSFFPSSGALFAIKFDFVIVVNPQRTHGCIFTFIESSWKGCFHPITHRSVINDFQRVQ